MMDCIDTSTWDRGTFSGVFHVSLPRREGKFFFALTNVSKFNYGDYVLFLFLSFCEY